VSSKAFQTFSNVDRAQPFRPRHDLVGDHLHPLSSGGLPIRELTTVSRRSYVPPEVNEHYYAWDIALLIKRLTYFLGHEIHSARGPCGGVTRQVKSHFVFK
jgi:hypothetical protein